MPNETMISRFIQTASILCAVMVIGLHAYNTAELDQWTVSARIVGSFSHGLFMAAVPIFFFVSGFLFFRGVASVKDVFNKQKRRVVRLLVPFLAWSAFYCLLYYYLDGSFSALLHPEGIWRFLQDIIFYRYVFPLWFLFQLMVFVLLTPILYQLLKNKTVAVILLSAVFFLGICKIDLTIDMVDSRRTLFAFNFFFYFLLGSFIARQQKLETVLQSMLTWNSAGIGISVLLLSVAQGILYDTTGFFNRRLLVPFLAVAVLAVIAKLSVRIPDRKWIAVCYAVPTLVVYGIHQMVESVISRYLRNFTDHVMLEFWSVFLLSTLVSFAIAWTVKKIKPINFLFNGNRS